MLDFVCVAPIKITARLDDFVLDVGSGGNPHSTSNILVERFLEDVDLHRQGKSTVHDRPLICADIAHLPFGNSAFDYAICNQVIEHLDDPASGLRELERVARRGFIATPSELGEMLFPHPQHRWVLALKDGKLLLKRKQPYHDLGRQRLYGGLFWMLQEDAEFLNLMQMHEPLFSVRLEWTDHIDFEIVPDDMPFYDYENFEDVRELLALTPPTDPIDSLKRFIKRRTNNEQMVRLMGIKARLRGLFRKVLGRA